MKGVLIFGGLPFGIQNTAMDRFAISPGLITGHFPNETNREK